MTLYNSEMKKVKDEEAKKELEKKVKEENRILALLLAKYDLDIDCEWRDLMDAITEKNKYLDLAYALEKNRGDWNEGYDYAESGLNRFKVVTEQDQEIYDNIYSYFDDFCDGRVFRDCEWNYGRLYGLVDNNDLMKDFETVKSHLD